MSTGLLYIPLEPSRAHIQVLNTHACTSVGIRSKQKQGVRGDWWEQGGGWGRVGGGWLMGTWVPCSVCLWGLPADPEQHLVDFISASRRFYAAWACFNIFPKPISHHRGVRGLMVRVCFQLYMVYQQYINQRLLSRVWGRDVWANLRAMSPAIIVLSTTLNAS